MKPGSNPYLPPNEKGARVSATHQRRWLDGRCFAVVMLMFLMGALVWKAQSTFCATPTFQPAWAGLIGWFGFSGFIAGCIDPRSPWIHSISLYIGAYVLTLPFFPADPLLPLGMILGLFFTAIPFCLGTMVQTLAAYTVTLQSPAARWWAGFVPALEMQTDKPPEP
ncbi:MAG: hypothetical protein WBD31_04725 [Rubripirellula sp.]